MVHYDPWLTADGKRAGRAFGVRAIPAWFVYDAQGKLVMEEVGAWSDAQLDAGLREKGI